MFSYTCWEEDEVEVPLDGWTEYKFNISCAGVTSPLYVNVKDPDGLNVTYYFEGWASEEGLDGWGYGGTYGRFRSGRPGNYTFSICGFVGDPYISLNVYRLGEPREKVYYPFKGFMFVGFALWGLGIAVSIVGSFRRKAG